MTTSPATTADAGTLAGSPAEGPPNRRERKKLATRSALEEAALRLFAEKGYEHTTVEEIAAAADVAVRTFFRYFSSKRHVLFGDVAHGRLDRMRAALAARPAAEPPLESIRAVLDLLDLAPGEEEQILRRLRLLDRQPSLRATYLMLNNDLRHMLAEFVAERTGLSADRDAYPLLLASAAVASWDVALHMWAAAGGGPALRALRRDAFAALTAGIPLPHPTSRRVAR